MSRGVGVAIVLPERDGDNVLVSCEGAQLQLQRTQPPHEWRSERLYKRLLDARTSRSKILDEVGRSIGQWLLGDPGDDGIIDLLVELAARAERENVVHSITIRGDRLSPWPWEIAHHPALAAAIGVHRGFAVMRVQKSPQREYSARNSVMLVGIELEKTAANAALATRNEVENIRSKLAAIPGLDIQPFPFGQWADVMKRIESSGPPAVFHFAGHGDGEGEGLVFRGASGAAESVSAARLSTLLGASAGCNLVVLNACASGAAHDPEVEPFGGVAQRLVRNGIPAVVAHQTPIADMMAASFASDLYGGLARRQPLDLAVQATRRNLHLKGSDLEWPFAVLLTGGKCPPVLGEPRRFSAQEIDAIKRDLAFFTEQRASIVPLISKRQSFVSVIFGPERAGHRFLTERIRNDFEVRASVVWTPVDDLKMYLFEDPELTHPAILGAIAEAATGDSSGSDEELEQRIADWIQRSSAGNKIVVLDVTHACTAATPEEESTIVSIVDPIWKKVTEKAGCTTVLMFSLAYPQSDSVAPNRQKSYINRAVARLRKIEPFAAGRVIVKVLDELVPIQPAQMKNALTLVTQTPDAQAQVQVERLQGYDNEYLLDFVDRLLKKGMQL